MFMSARDLVANETGFASVNFSLLNEAIWASVGHELAFFAYSLLSESGKYNCRNY